MYTRSDIKDIYPLSPMQEGMLLHSIISDASKAYFEQITLDVEGNIDLDIYEESFNKILQRYDILRTVFMYEKVKSPVQVVLKERKAEIYYEDIATMNVDKKLYVEQLKEADKQKGFDLTKDLLIRISIIRIEEKCYKVIWSFHHILMDGWCLGIIMGDFAKIYYSIKTKNPINLTSTYPYSHFIKWIHSQNKKKVKDYWEKYLEGYEEQAVIAFKKSSESSLYEKEDIIINLGEELTNNIYSLAKSQQVTTNTIFQAVWGIILQRYNNKSDVVFGAVVSGRPSEVVGIESMVGLFINAIPVRVRVDKDETFAQLLRSIHDTSKERQSYEFAPLAEIQSGTELKQELINHIMVFENYPVEEEISKKDNGAAIGFSIKGIEIFEQTNYDFNIAILPKKELVIHINYNKAVYDSELINNIGGHFTNVLGQIVKNSDIKNEDIELLKSSEKNKILIDFNNTYMDYPKNKVLHELFEKQVEQTPDSIAVVYEDKCLTYRELNEKANQLARVIRHQNLESENIIGSNNVIGIMVERSLDMIVGMLGILKAGGAYLPIDPKYPVDRIKYMLEDSKAKLLITQEHLVSRVSYAEHNILIDDASIYQGNNTNLKSVTSSNSLGCIIYTSGTTGNPKGVMVEHGGICNTLQWRKSEYKFGINDKVLQLFSFCFDAFVTSFFTPIISGSKVVLVSEEEARDPLTLKNHINTYGITHVAAIPTIYLSILEYANKGDLISLKVVTLGGEKLTNKVIRKSNSINKKIQIVNEYGPTENTVVTTSFTVDKEYENIPIGKPISNTGIYILDKNNKLCPIGVAGELCIAGNGLARGYLNRPELTAEKFIANPFNVGSKLYKTGDVARWISDGNIEFLSRIDNQVKIRGFRIELGEIENKLLTYDSIKEALVLVRKDNHNNNYMCAYVIAHRGETLTVEELRQYLTRDLPDYMIPAHFIQLDKMPLTQNGKIDRRALPEPDGNIATEIEYEAPQNELQEKLVSVWKEVLGAERIGINDSFFMLGGDSIKAIQVCSRLQKHNVKLEIKYLLKYPTIKEVSKHVTYNIKKVEQGVIEGQVQLTPIIKWFFEKNFTNKHHWNQSVMLYNKEAFNKEALIKAFDKILEHHDALRIVCEDNNGEMVLINKGIGSKLYEFSAIDLKDEENYRDIITEEANKIQRSIDLNNGPLVQLGLFNTKVGDHLLIVIHHLVIDGVSWRIIFEDLATAYGQALKATEIVLQQKTDSFKRWSEEQIKYANSKSHLKELQYWKEIQQIEVIPLLKDNTVDKDILKDTANVQIQLTEEETEKLLKKSNKAYNTEINDLLLTALGMTIKEWTGNDKILIDIEGHGRDIKLGELDITRTVGWFTSLYPIILNMGKTDNIYQAIVKTKEALRKIPNKGIGYGILKYLTAEGNSKHVNFSKEANGIKKADVSFNYLGQFDKDINTEAFEISNLSTGNSMNLESERNYSLDISGVVINNRLNISLRYNKNEYRKSTIEKLIQCYRDSLIEIIDHCTSKEETEITPSDTTGNNIEIEDFELIKKYLREDGVVLSKVEDIYPLAPMQEGMLFHSLFEDNSNSYFEQTTLYIDGELDIELFNKSLNRIIEKYGVLRTIFVNKGLKRPVQVILKECKAKLNYIDISGLEANYRSEFLGEYEEKDKQKGFDLFKEIPIRASVLKLSERSYALIWSFHHIIMDGWCLSLIIKDFFTSYIMEKEGKEIKLNGAESYSKYIAWLEQQDMEEAISYWKEYLIDYEQKASIHPIKTVKNLKSYENNEKLITLNKNITLSLVKFSQECEVTLNTVIQALWGLILQRYNNVDDVVFGAVVSGRPAEIKGIEEMVGLFINTIPIRFKTSGEETLEEVIRVFHSKSLESKKFEYISLAEVQANCNLKQELIDSIIVFENYPVQKEIENSTKTDRLGFEIKSMESFSQTNYGINLTVLPGDELTISIGYNGAIYEEEQIEEVLGHLCELIKNVQNNKATKLNEINIITEKEKQKLLYQFNDTFVQYPTNRAIHQVFEEQVQLNPDKIAAIYVADDSTNKTLTYNELNKRANQVAHYLTKLGVCDDSIVGMMVDRSLDMLIGMLGILKAGGAYLPIDPDYPQDRIDYMIEDSSAVLLLTQTKFNGKTPNSIKTIYLDKAETFGGQDTNLDNIVKQNNLAYIIYTSGSTGIPKGVMVEHRNIVAYVEAFKKEYKLTSKDTILQQATYCFDAFVEEVYPILTLGGKIVIVNKYDVLDIDKLSNIVNKNNISIISCSPLMLNELNKSNHFETVRIFISGGDVIKHEYFNKLKKTASIYNTYGPTEATVCATYYNCIQEDLNISSNIPIGRPISNYRIYILNNNKLQPVGVHGELCIAGAGLARGYLNREELTAEKFVDDPFVSGEKMYRTGDLARWLPDGNIEFMGRIDCQVKIRGFRIELGEIETKLLNYPEIKEAVVEAREDSSGNKNLCAYIILNSKLEQEFSLINLRKYLSKELPDYMIPLYFIKLDKFPLTSSGKLDRKTLVNWKKLDCVELNGNKTTDSQYEVPRNKIEEKLAEIWKEILKLEKVSINDSFFELGGHSLKATSMVAKLRKELNVEVPLKEVFSTPTIKGLAECIGNLEENIYKGIPVAKASDFYPEKYFEISSAQKRLYALQQFDLQSIAYNMPVALTIEGELDLDRLNITFCKLIERHDSLRTSFEILKGDIVQKIDSKVSFEIDQYEADEEKLGQIVKGFVKAFYLSTAPLIRVGLVKFSTNKYALLLDMHHIISDGVSVEIITKEFVRLYNNQELTPLRIQYKDYAAWQNQLMKSELMRTQEEYWLKAFAGELPILALQTDYQRPVIQNFNGGRVLFDLDKGTADKLRMIVKETGTTMYMTLLAAFNVLLSKYTGQDDIIIGSPIAGRPHTDLENIVGMLVNTLAMRNYPQKDKTFKKFLLEVKETALKAYENQDYQFDELVEKLNIRRDMSRNPLFDVMFVMQNIETEEATLHGLNIRAYKSNNNISKFDITLEAADAGDRIALSLEYCSKLFKKETIERMSQHLRNVIKEVVDNIDKKLLDIDILDEEEKQKLLLEFNETYANYPKTKTIQELFEEQVQKTPNNTAVVFEDKHLTYRELNCKANQLARTLRDRGVKSDSIVGMVMERSIEMIIGIIAILKAGGAYLPIDPEYPKDRIEYTLQDSGANILLTQGNLRNTVNFEGHIILLDEESKFEEEIDNLPNINRPQDIAYVIYTSGTTGKPKGTMIEHRNVVRLMINDKVQFEFKDTDVWTMFHSYCFDFSVWEMYGALLYGGKLVVIPRLIARDVWEYVNILRQEKVSVLNQTPSAFYRLVDEELKSNDKDLNIRYVIFGGEALKPIMLKAFRNKYPQTKLINMYGITETTVHVTYKEITEYEIQYNISNIGKPIPTLTTYIMDNNMRLMPIGSAGELCVGGSGVGRGYLNKSELTAEKFVVNPYKPDEIIYRSGDLVRILSNGEMEYLGRIDHQVKIRGFRIELGEIETVLKNHPWVKSVVVTAYSAKDSNDNKLIAYVVPHNEDKLNDVLLRNFMREKLPDYMIPSVFIMIDAIPLTSNGKIDSNALPIPEIERVNKEENYVAPRTSKEEILAEIWAKALGLDKVGIYDEFFDLGGDSIYSIKVVALAKDRGLNCSVQQIFLYPTIAELAQQIEMQEPKVIAKELETVHISEEKPKAFGLLSADDTAKLFGFKK